MPFRKSHREIAHIDQQKSNDARIDYENRLAINSRGHLLEDLENHVSTPQLEQLPIEIVQIENGSRIVYHTEPRSAGADRFRALRMRLRERQSAGTLKSILITSPLPHDGKSTLILNLATALAERGKKAVLVVEADLHRPALTQQLGLNSIPGMAECLLNKLPPMAVIRRIEPLAWYLLTAGIALNNPSELMQAETLPRLMEKLSSLFDWILIDSPPVVPLADTLALAKNVDATLLVAMAGQTPRRAVDEAIALLGRQQLLGVVLNGIPGLDRYYSGYGYY